MSGTALRSSSTSWARFAASLYVGTTATTCTARRIRSITAVAAGERRHAWAVASAAVHRPPERRCRRCPRRPLGPPPSPPSSSPALAGALIGYSLVELQCTATAPSRSASASSPAPSSTAAGMSVVAVLVLRAARRVARAAGPRRHGDRRRRLDRAARPGLPARRRGRRRRPRRPPSGRSAGLAARSRRRPTSSPPTTGPPRRSSSPGSAAARPDDAIVGEEGTEPAGHVGHLVVRRPDRRHDELRLRPPALVDVGRRRRRRRDARRRRLRPGRSASCSPPPAARGATLDGEPIRCSDARRPAPRPRRHRVRLRRRRSGDGRPTIVAAADRPRPRHPPPRLGRHRPLLRRRRPLRRLLRDRAPAVGRGGRRADRPRGGLPQRRPPRRAARHRASCSSPTPAIFAELAAPPRPAVDAESS